MCTCEQQPWSITSVEKYQLKHSTIGTRFVMVRVADMCCTAAASRYTRQQCSACGASTRLLQCASCRSHGYCCRECQLQLWPSHKALCRMIAAQAEAELKAIVKELQPDEAVSAGSEAAT